jgi:hypothetical protein
MYTIWFVVSQIGIYVLFNGLVLEPTVITPVVMDITAFGRCSNILFQIYKTVLNFSEGLESIIVQLNCIITFVYLVELWTNVMNVSKLPKKSCHLTVTRTV